MFFSFTQSPHRSLSSLEQNPGKDDQRQRGPHPTGVCWCQMNFQEHRVVHVDGHPILDFFWRMIQTWQEANITMRKIPGFSNRGKDPEKYLNTPGDSIRNFVTLIPPFGDFLKCWYPTTMGFPTRNDHFGVFWGYHHLRKHPFGGPTKFGRFREKFSFSSRLRRNSSVAFVYIITLQWFSKHHIPLQRN